MLYAVALASLVSILLQSLGSRDLWIQAAGVSFWIVVALPLARYWPVSERILPEYRGGDAWPQPGFSQASRISSSLLDE